MTPTKLTLTLASVFLYSLSLLSMTSAIVVNADYITIYPGEQGKVAFEIDNNENFDIEDVSVQLIMSILLPDKTIISLPFTVVGSSEKDVDDIDEDDSDEVSFTIKASTSIKPGDYEIPYELRYTNVETDDSEKKTGTFAIRVSTKTELDFAVEVKDNAVVGKEGTVSLEIINKGLGEIKSVSVQVFPKGFELLSKDKIFIGTIDADDTDVASFDVIYKETSPTLSAKITYKDFDNKDQTKTVDLPFKVYTEKEALELGIIKKNNTGIYILVIAILIVAWLVWRRIKKSRKKNKHLERV